MPRRTTAAPPDPRVMDTAGNYQGMGQNAGGFRPQQPKRQQVDRSSSDQQNFDTGRFGAQNAQDNPTPYQPTPEGLQQFANESRMNERQNVTSEMTPPAMEGARDAGIIEQEMNQNAQQGIRNDQLQQAIGKDQIRKAFQILQKYKQGKQHLEDKIVRNEKWWRLRHWDLMEREENLNDPKPASAWLFNTIISKHADFMDNFPSSVILPREPGDKDEAQRLSSIIPVVMEQNGYREVYASEVWYKLKHGIGVFGCFWDQDKLNGLGDISITEVDILSLFWEPGIKDIQKSKNLFYVQLIDNDDLEAAYPQTRGQLHTAEDDSILKKYMNDDSVDTAGKSLVIDWYYHKNINGKNTLQFCKFTGDIVLYATENDTQQPTQVQQVPITDEYGNTIMDTTGMPLTQDEEVPVGEPISQRGLYDHGMYPFIFDKLFPETDTPVGFGFIDVCKNPQASIDIYNNAFEKNVQFAANPRYFVRDDGAINTEAFSNPSQMFIPVDGNLGQDDIRAVDPPPALTGTHLSVYQDKINEMKETSGNRDVSNGGTTAGATAASAIAALQESSGKTSRDQISTTFSAHKNLVTMVIELIRQFYDMPRQFRIIGRQGEEDFTIYSNENLQPQYQGEAFGEDMGYRLPVFDVQVEAEKSSAYSRLSQNELALSFYNAGFFEPTRMDQAVACLEMMDFNGKQDMMNRIRENGGMYQQMLNMQQQMLQMGQMIDQLTGGRYGLSSQVADEVNVQLNEHEGQQGGPIQVQVSPASDESGVTRRAREQAAQTTSPS